ncbi:hypothetical protein [uncultured Sneathia sp.]|uniref:hypothetical protein n=1 Tax=uncultured Sneathia sp. TaxID=278067 RepID=UPI0028045E98|nr:hypothetical protein [uncultured Sneathia sp.]
MFELHNRSDEEILNTHSCEILNKSPYVCNNCPRYTNNHCTYHYLEYIGSNAHEKYLKLKSISNKIQKNIDLIKEINEALIKG